MACPGLPAWITKRDGRIVPFDADNISQALYAATVEVGQPSPFLARELTDGVLHFLAEETGTEQPTTAQVAELVTKVVRELGQPTLAQIYAEAQRRYHQDSTGEAPRKPVRADGAFHFSTTAAPDAVLRQCLRAFSLQGVFARDLAAAHEEGLLTLHGLEYPEELARLVVEPRAAAEGWLELVNAPARMVIFDGPEYALTEEVVGPWLRGLAQFCAATDRQAVLNLNVPPPVWANADPAGPLFAAPQASAERALNAATILLEEALKLDPKHCHVNWHLSEHDLAGISTHAWERILGKGRSLGFLLDRPKRPLLLGPGVDRRQPAALLDVSLDLPRFLGRSEIACDAGLFLQKLPSLARMAVRAGVQKRNFLRRRSADRPALARGFLLERARLVIVPLGLEKVVTTLLGQGTAGSKLSLDLAKQTLETLQNTVAAESNAVNLEVALDGQDDDLLWLRAAGDKRSLQAAGVLQGVTGFGAAGVLLASSQEAGAAGLLADLLAYALKKTDVVRLVVAQSAPTS